ncbi:conserved protein of unknown function [Pseudomonas marincola]|uniref:Uncharacterized protein n=1 Tax=Pseudomonas marincola TaxID=437900 RepID=A0A653E9R4_9PSED|nr:conserved protein of unknown function [Pseudomonas marincola]
MDKPQVNPSWRSLGVMGFVLGFGDLPGYEMPRAGDVALHTLL